MLVTQGVVDVGGVRVVVAVRIRHAERSGDDVRTRVHVDGRFNLGGGIGQHAGIWNLDDAVGAHQLRTLGVHQIAFRGHGDLAVTRVHGLAVLTELEEAIPRDRKVEVSPRRFQVTVVEVLHHAGHRSTQAELGVGVNVSELRVGRLEAGGRGVGDVVTDHVQVLAGSIQTGKRLRKTHGVTLEI
ncbi:hypothetical protein D3C84_903130 [compost metagenome]